MLFGMAAASSALDLIKTLTQSGASSKSNGTTKFSAATDSLSSSSSASTGFSGASSQSNLIAPDTMNALFAAQGQSDTSSTSSTSKSDALKNLFNTLDADGDGKISKSEFESALGAGGTNTTNADNVFDKLDTDRDGSVSASELSSALKGKRHAHGSKGGGTANGEDALMQAIDGANATTTSNSDGSTTSTITFADGSTVTMTTPAASSSSTSATRSYNAIEQMLKQQVNALSKGASVSPSVSVNA